ncbi:hypothetical protein D9619_010215 [Psilocybe cf. subviscida]|uniref:FAD-binding domain-containing protein n=1 Tax=Psilocybe cf. subviscida TaxID=2480587 RepID=A0A8H5ASE2_9AGAR|nr:hypothetical protein D9619_010215 [Psilocybe cf. subviscida]
MDKTTLGPLRIAIVGAGIGGLTLSAALGQLGKNRALEVNLYESASEISAIGAGITFWPRQWKIIKTLGIDESLLKFTPSVSDDLESLVCQIRKSDQKEGFYVDDIVVKGGMYRFHRADLQNSLMSHMKGTLHLGHQFVSFKEVEDEVILTFANGTVACCDLLVGMDGINSVVRRGLLLSQGHKDSPSMEPGWMGQVVYRGLVSEEALNAHFPNHMALDTPMMYSGKNKQIITYPVKHTTKFINIGAIITDPSKSGTPYNHPPAEASTAELLNLFSEFEPQVQALLSCIERPMRFPVKWLIPLERYTCGRVVLGGDAAHAMPPYQGAGAGVAIEDAYILAHLLSHSGVLKANVSKAVEIYDIVRTPEGNRVLDGSIACGDIAQLRGLELDAIEEGDHESARARLKKHFDGFSKYLEWLWLDNAEEGREQALRMLEERLDQVA